MHDYKNILIAVDLSASAEDVIKKAKNIADINNTKLTLIHAIDYIPYIGFGEGALITPTYTIPNEELIKNAKNTIDRLLNKMQLTHLDIIIEFGAATNEIVSYANEHNVDLIVVGSHGRHGVKLLLGATANGVLHHAPCDVLAIRITE
ncbi:MAG: universal stress protein [Gammaproteobacteria bacterium]|nr:universal stress protein [Gammaproteobacteria bacterium]